jgi:hypothetical protein
MTLSRLTEVAHVSLQSSDDEDEKHGPPLAGRVFNQVNTTAGTAIAASTID